MPSTADEIPPAGEYTPPLVRGTLYPTNALTYPVHPAL